MIQPGLHSTNMVNQSVTLETDLSKLQIPIPDGTLVYSRDSQIIWVFSPTSTAGTIAGVSRPANGGGAFLAIANLSSLGGDVAYFNTVNGGVVGQIGLKDVTPSATVGAIVGGNAASQDGLAGDNWFWNPTSAAADDGQTVIRPTSLPATGRWIRIANQFIGYTAGPAVNVLTPTIFLNSAAAFTMQMHDNTTGVGRNVVIAAGASTNAGSAGGNLDLKAGDAGAGGTDGAIRLFFGTSEASAGSDAVDITLSGANLFWMLNSATNFFFRGTGLFFDAGSTTFRGTGGAGNALIDISETGRRIGLLDFQGTILAGTDGVNIIGIDNVTTTPTVNPVGGGILYVAAGAGTWRGSGGTVTTFAPA